jgi:hypothetical protein
VQHYVLALTDQSPGIGRIGGRHVHDVHVDGVHAICQRRTRVPAITDEALRRQHADVIAISRRVPAILPVRFGALLTRDDLTTILRTSAGEIHQALDEVRGRVQMTVRVRGIVPTPIRGNPSTGRQYLEQRRRAAAPVLPRHARAFLDVVKPLVTRERREAGTAGLLASIYHLVDAAHVAEYERIARSITDADLVWSGPWPPFAFTPPLLR